MPVKPPEKYLSRMKELLGKRFEEYERLLGEEHIRGIRINTLKFPCEREKELGLALEQVRFCEQGRRLLSSQRVGASPFHHAGAFYSQEPSAMCAVTALAPEKGDRVLDMCAAPGGKSTQIAALLDGSGLLCSNEYIRARTQALISNLERVGVRNAAAVSLKPDVLEKCAAGFFDKVLVDAPCSGEGMFRREEAAVAEWSPEHVEACALRQRLILDSAAETLREGGVMVYSTCTFSQQENEGSVLAFLERHPEFCLEPINEGFGESGLNLSDKYDLTLTRRVYPMDGGEGHFAARLRKLGEGARAQCASPARRSAVEDRLTEKLLDDVLESYTGRVLTLGDKAYLISEQLEALPFPVLRAGVLAAELKTGRAEPAHALFMSRRPEECRRVIDFLPDDPRLLAFLRGEELDAQGAENGYTAVCCAGVTTGFGKVSGGRLKNRYPKGLRITR